LEYQVYELEIAAEALVLVFVVNAKIVVHHVEVAGSHQLMVIQERDHWVIEALKFVEKMDFDSYAVDSVDVVVVKLDVQDVGN
jgi:hypothetical protein